MVLIRDEAVIIDALVKFMRRHSLNNMIGSWRTGNWRDFSVELNKGEFLNEQSRLSYQWNKLDSSLKKMFLKN